MSCKIWSRLLQASSVMALLGLNPACIDSAAPEDESEPPPPALDIVADTGPRSAPACDIPQDLEFSGIDDFETGAAINAFTNNEVCAPCFALEDELRVACEERCRASQFPTDFDKPLPAQLIPGGRCGSLYALHVTTAQLYEWGGLVGFPFLPAMDVSAYDGVAFWGRVAWAGRSALRIVALDPATDASFVDPESGRPLCEGQSTLDVFSDACDPFGAFVVLTGDWQLFLVPFDEMRQRGFGRPSLMLNVEEVRSVSVEYGLGEWDVWIDDIAFYRRRDR